MAPSPSARPQGRPVSQTERAYAALRGRILEFELVPGAPLLEEEIAAEFAMSRTPVREALRRLASEGLVQSIPYKGAYVRTVSRRDVQDIYESAEGLEGMVAWLAAQRATPMGVERLREAVAAMGAAHVAHDVDAFIEADEAFHATLHAMCENPVLQEALRRLYEQVHRVRVLTSRAWAGKDASVEEHQAACEAVAAGDHELARAVTQRHWQRVRAASLALVP